MMRSRAYVFPYQGDTAVNKIFIFIPVTMTCIAEDALNVAP